MAQTKGFVREDEMVIHLNDKKVKELTNNCRTLVEDLFGALDEEEILECRKTEGSIKPDFIITYQGENHFVSMKSGRSNIVHQEIVKNFVLFLRSLGVSKETQKTILLFHYGDKTMDGSGKDRFPYEYVALWLKERIKRANDELNANKELIWKVVERCVFLGSIEGAIGADFIYHGDVRYGTAISKSQLEKHIKRKPWDYLDNLHIGPLHIRPSARYAHTSIRNEKRRQRLECFWPHIREDIEYIYRRYGK